MIGVRHRRLLGIDRDGGDLLTACALGDTS